MFCSKAARTAGTAGTAVEVAISVSLAVAAASGRSNSNNINMYSGGWICGASGSRSQTPPRRHAQAANITNKIPLCIGSNLELHINIKHQNNQNTLHDQKRGSGNVAFVGLGSTRLDCWGSDTFFKLLASLSRARIYERVRCTFLDFSRSNHILRRARNQYVARVEKRGSDSVRLLVIVVGLGLSLKHEARIPDMSFGARIPIFRY